MKLNRILVFLLAVLVLLGSFALAEGTLAFKELPDDVSDLEVDPQNPIRNLVVGPWIEKVTVKDGLTFDVYDYIPETANVCEKALIIVLDSGVKADEFILSSGWKEIADTNSVSLMLVQNLDGWKDDENAVAKVNAVYTAAKARHYYDFSWDLLDLIAYGEGTTPAMQFNMSAPDSFAAVVLFGGEPVTQAYMDETGALPSAEAGVTKGEVKCPVWIFADELTDGVRAEVDYWRAANGNTGSAFSNALADEVYMPSNIYHGTQIDDANIAQTRLTVGKNVDGTGAEFLQAVYDEFLWMYARHRGIGNQEMRYYVNPEDYGMTLHSAEVDGLVRYWYVYVPESVKEAGKPVPLVVSMAGRGGSASTFASLTDWPLLANDRGFICAFPIAGLGRQLPNGVGNIPMWNSQTDDVAFLRYMVNDIKANYPIDAGRVYANGQSMGSMMSMRASVCLSDVFTATGSTCGALPANAVESEYYSEEYDCAAWLVYGEKDTTVGSYKISESDSVKNALAYYIDRYDLCSVEEASTYRSGPFTHYVFYNKENVPMFRYTVVDNKGHANLPSESYMLYDEFFSKFYRDENGVLHYEDSDNVLDIH